MRKASIFLTLSFLSVSSLHAEIFPVKKSTIQEAYLLNEFSYPIKRPPQPLLSQILSNKDYELFELALKKAGDYEALQKLPKNASPIRLHNRCKLTGRPKGYMRQFGISRVTFREMANKGLIPGVTKASW